MSLVSNFSDTVLQNPLRVSAYLRSGSQFKIVDLICQITCKFSFFELQWIQKELKISFPVWYVWFGKSISKNQVFEMISGNHVKPEMKFLILFVLQYWSSKLLNWNKNCIYFGKRNKIWKSRIVCVWPALRNLWLF